jgi:hypothetical protein
MTAITIFWLVYRATSKTRLRASWDSLALIALYVGAMYVIYNGGAP